MQKQVRSNQYYSDLQFIPFVTSSTEEKERVINKSSTAFSGKLDGKEIRHFYEEVISAPSSALISPSIAKKVYKNTKNSNDCRIKDKNRSIFHYAQNGDIEGIKCCLSQGCNINSTDMYNWTPLMCAAFEGHINIVAYLIEFGANLNLQSKEGYTALDLAVQKNNQAVIKLLKKGKVEEMPVTVTKFEDVVKFCNLCNSSYKESAEVHDKSIAHLLNCKKGDISTYYHIPEDNKGFQIMLRKGWDKNKGLGSDASGRKFPIKTVLKSDRTCIGRKKEVPKVTHFGPKEYSSVKRHNQPAAKMVREKTYKKRELQKLQRKSRQKEIEFRRQFNMEF